MFLPLTDSGGRSSTTLPTPPTPPTNPTPPTPPTPPTQRNLSTSMYKH